MGTKKILTILLVLVFILSLTAMVGCADPEPAPADPDDEEEVDDEEETALEDVTITIVVGFGAGGSNDLTARYTAEYLSDYGITARVVNMPGGMSTEAAHHVSRQEPESYMFFWGHTGPLLFEPAAGDRGYTIEDFEPVALMCAPTFAIGQRKGAPWGSDFEALIEYIKENPGEVTFGGQGEGNVRHYAVEQILPPDELDYVFVGLEGGADVAMNLQGGHIDIGHLSLAAASPLHQDGDMDVLVNTNPLVDRDPLMPDVPNVSEYGIPEGREPHPIGLWAIPGTDAELIQRISDALAEIAENPDFQESFSAMGVAVAHMDPQEAWDFYMDVNENVVGPYLEWLDGLN